MKIKVYRLLQHGLCILFNHPRFIDEDGYYALPTCDCGKYPTTDEIHKFIATIPPEFEHLTK